MSVDENVDSDVVLLHLTDTVQQTICSRKGRFLMGKYIMEMIPVVLGDGYRQHHSFKNQKRYQQYDRKETFFE